MSWWFIVAPKTSNYKARSEWLESGENYRKDCRTSLGGHRISAKCTGGKGGAHLKVSDECLCTDVTMCVHECCISYKKEGCRWWVKCKRELSDSRLEWERKQGCAWFLTLAGHSSRSYRHKPRPSPRGCRHWKKRPGVDFFVKAAWGGLTN